MPNEWVSTNLGQVAEVIAGQSPKSKFYNYENEGLPFYQGKKEFGETHIRQESKWTSEITKEAFKGDILMSVRAPVGPVNFATKHLCFGRGLAAIRPSNYLDTAYCFYFLRCIEDDLVGNNGAVFNSINKKQIEEIQIPLPPLPTQRAIVARLDAAFARIDRARANLERNVTNAKELFQSKLNEVFSRRGDGWTPTTLGQSCEFWNGKPHEKSISEEGKYVVVNSKFISSDGVVRKYTNEQMFPLYENDIVFVMSDVPNGKALAKCYVIKQNDLYSLNQRICAIRSKVFHTKFLYYQLNRNPHLLAFNNGENQTNLRKGDILKTPLYQPSLKIQKAIAKELDKFRNLNFLVLKSYIKRIQDLSDLKQSLLQKAFRGELIAEAEAESTSAAH